MQPGIITVVNQTRSIIHFHQTQMEEMMQATPDASLSPRGT